MAKQKHVLNVVTRSELGKGAVNRQRKAGHIPAVVYSKGAAAKTIYFGAAEWEALQKFELNLIALKEGDNEILALILAFGGTVLLATHGNLTQLSVSKTTLIFGLSSAVATIFYNLVPGNLMDIYGTFPMVGWGMLISGIGLTPFVQPWTLVEDITWDWQCIGCIVVVIIFGTVMSFSCYMEGVRLIGGSKASLLASVEPLTATAMSVIFMHVAFSGMDLAGFVGIIAGVIILSLPKKK